MYKFVLKKHLFITQSFFGIQPHQTSSLCQIIDESINKLNITIIKHYLHNRLLMTVRNVSTKWFCWKSRHARISRSFRSLSLLPPKRLYDLFDVTIHLQQDGNWKCSITGFPSWLMANKLLYTYCCLHLDSMLNGKFCENSHGKCAFLQIEKTFVFFEFITFNKLKLTSILLWEHPADICYRRWWWSAMCFERFGLFWDGSIASDSDTIRFRQHQTSQQSCRWSRHQRGAQTSPSLTTWWSRLGNLDQLYKMCRHSLAMHP